MKLFTFILVVVFYSIQLESKNYSDVLREFIGGEGKMIWVECEQNNAKDVFLAQSSNTLVGINTEKNTDIVPLMKQKFPMRKPLISPDGKKIFFTDAKNYITYYITWDNPKPVKFADGICMQIWTDPKTKQDWVYVGEQAYTHGLTHLLAKTIKRYKLDKPSEFEIVWKDQNVVIDNFDLTMDGKEFVSLFPWPYVGIGYFNDNNWKFLYRGCWPSFLPIRHNLEHKIVSILDGPHKNLRFFTTNPAHRWELPINSHKNLKTHEVYHPMWSNHWRYMTITGPYKNQQNINVPDIFDGGKFADVYVLKLADTIDKVEKWLHIPRPTADFQPDLWIKNVNADKLDFAKVIKDKKKYNAWANAQKDKWPGKTKNMDLVFLWKSLNHDNVIKLNKKSWLGNNKKQHCFVEMKEKARPSKEGKVSLDGGYLKLSNQDVKRVKESIKKSNELNVEFVVTPKHEQKGSKTLCVFRDDKKDYFEIIQDGSKVRFEFYDADKKTYKTNSIGPIYFGAENHIYLAMKEGRMELFLNGARKFSPVKGKPKFKLDIKKWKFDKIIFGKNKFRDSSDWYGNIERIAFYSQFSDKSSKINTNFIQLMNDVFNKREKVKKLKVLAIQLDDLAIPNPKSINEYNRSLVVAKFKLKDVIEGSFPEKYNKNEFYVARWSIIDKKVLQDLNRKKNKVVELELENFMNYSGLESERFENDTDKIDFLDISTPSGKLK